MKRIRIALLCLLVSGCTVAQEPHKEVAKPNKEITENAKASFPGGQEALQTYYIENYDRMLMGESEGKVYIEVDIDEEGKVSNAHVMNLPNTIGVGNKAIEEECLRIAERMPNWNPQVMSGKTAKAPVSFGVIVSKNSLTIDL